MLRILVAPSHLFAGQRLLAEFALRGGDRFEVVSGVDDAAVVEHLAHPVARRVAAAAAIDVFEDVLDHRIILAHAVEARRLVAGRRLAGRNDVGLGPRPPHPDKAIHRVADRGGRLDRGRVHHPPAPHQEPIRLLLADLEPGRSLLDAGRRHRVFEKGEAVFLCQLIERRDRLLAVGNVDIDEADLLALEPVHTAELFADIADHIVGLVPIGRRKGEDIRKHRAVARIGAAVAHRDDRDLVGGGALDQRIGDAGRQRIDEARPGRRMVFQPFVALDPLVVVVAGLALLIGDLDAADAAVARVDHVDIVDITVRKRDAVRRVGPGTVDEPRDELLRRRRHSRPGAEAAAEDGEHSRRRQRT